MALFPGLPVYVLTIHRSRRVV